MRWIHLAIVVLFAVAILIFVWQNFETVTMSFLGFQARTPLALLIALAYLAGMATGGSLWSLLRRSFQKSGLAASSHSR
jgi:lipopolysaccharide assembly protein A